MTSALPALLRRSEVAALRDGVGVIGGVFGRVQAGGGTSTSRQKPLL